MYGFSYALVYLGEQYIDSALAAVLFGAYPFFVAALSWWIYRAEKLSLIGWLGMTVGLAGVVVISYDSFQASADIFLGTILLVAGALAAAYGGVLHKNRFSQVDIVIAANVQMILGGLFLVLGAAVLEDWSSFHFTTEAVGSIVYLALCGSVIAFLGYYWLLKHTRLTVVSLIAFITPLVAILVGVVLGRGVAYAADRHRLGPDSGRCAFGGAETVTIVGWPTRCGSRDNDEASGYPTACCGSGGRRTRPHHKSW